MKKLEIKHLAPYLPFRLLFIVNDTRQELSGLDTYIHANWKEPFQFDDMESVCYSYIDYSSMWSLKEIKPILRPLSDLKTEAIIDSKETQCLFEWEGEVYNISKVMDEIIQIIWEDVFKKDDRTCIDKVKLYDWCLNKTLTLPYYIIEILLKNHFDIFGLIKEGLAIDINTLNLQPCKEQ